MRKEKEEGLYGVIGSKTPECSNSKRFIMKEVNP
jgi:hypothetical protein